MCGICGIASERGSVDPERLRAMAATLFHRGPDSEGAHLDGPVGIAARRLAIIDLTGGDQPIANEDGSVVVVQNGEIYNYRELMRELERAGHTFRTRCDTEVLVHGYEEWGPELWARLRGMFAVAVWDARRRRLTLARDRFGIKPLYYRDVGGELSFASELDALPHGRDRPRRARGVPRVQLDPRAALDLPRHPQAAARSHADLARGSRRRSSASRARGRCRHGTTRTRPSSSRNAARACATRCART